MTDAKMLLLLQNEIGQIVGRRLTRSENHNETRQLLEHVKGIFDADDNGGEWFIISDNANSFRSLVADVFGSSSSVRQDPFHVVQRFTEKVKGKSEKKKMSKQLHDALYCIDGELRPPGEMESRFASVLQEVALGDLSCSEQKWRGTVDSNLKQIKRGDLYVESNVFSEGGGNDVRIVSTSQLEGFHSALKKMLARSVSAEVGLRILDLFILQHNLRVGSRYGRNSPLQHADILTLAQTATLCRGVIAESPQLEFVNQLMSKPLRQPAYRSATALDFGFQQWQQMFQSTRVDTQALEASLQRARQHSASIKELLAKQIAFTESGKLPRAAFSNSLCLNELDYEAGAGFSGEEYTLLRQVRLEQKATGQSWSDCSMVTTIMYNIVVSSNPNQRLKLKRRSFVTLATKIEGLAAKPPHETKATNVRKLFRFARSDPCDEHTSSEQELQIQLFTALRTMAGIIKRRQVFAMVYDFACCVCAGIHPKPRSALLARWDNLKHKSNQDANLKIKLKLTTEILASIRSTASTQKASLPARVSVTENSTNSPHAPEIQQAVNDRVPSPPQHPPTPPAISTELGHSERTLASSPSNEDATNRETSEGSNNTSGMAPSGDDVSVGISTPPTITDEHINMLRTLANSIPNSNGKWEYIQAVYTKHYPHLPLSKNALRCRLKEKKPTSKVATESRAGPATTSHKRRETSCSSCRQRKKKCGDLTRNPYCTQAKPTYDSQKESLSLDHYFALV